MHLKRHYIPIHPMYSRLEKELKLSLLVYYEEGKFRSPAHLVALDFSGDSAFSIGKYVDDE